MHLAALIAVDEVWLVIIEDAQQNAAVSQAKVDASGMYVVAKHPGRMRWQGGHQGRVGVEDVVREHGE